MLLITLSASASSALYGAALFLSKVHDLSSEALPIGWFRTIQAPALQPKGPDAKSHPIRRFDITAHIGCNPQMKVEITLDVQKVMTFGDIETWVPIYGILRFSDSDEPIAAYHCIFNPMTGEMTLFDMHRDGDRKYPFAFVTL